MKMNSELATLGWIIKSCLIKGSIVFLVIFFTSCATIPAQFPQIIVAPDNIGYGVDHILDIKFTQVSVPRATVSKILILLTKATNNTSVQIPYFSWDIRVQPSSPGRITEEDNPQITIKLTNVTLRQVLDELCKQAGWRYEESAIGISFTAPPKKILGIFEVSHPLPKLGSTGKYVY